MRKKKRFSNVVMKVGAGLTIGLEYDKTLTEIKQENKERTYEEK